MGLRSKLANLVRGGPEILFLSREPEKDVAARPLAIARGVADEPVLIKNTGFRTLPEGTMHDEKEEEGYIEDETLQRPVFIKTAVLGDAGTEALPAELTGRQLPQIQPDPLLEGVPFSRLDPSDEVDGDEVRCPECEAVNSERAMNCKNCNATVDPRVR